MAKDLKKRLDRIKSLNKEIYLRECRRDRNKFIEYVLKDNKNKSVKQGQIHRYWQWYINTCIAHGQKKIGILAPMEHGKTQNITVSMSLDLIGKNPRIRIQLLSCIDRLALDKAKSIKRIIEYSPEYHEVYPNIKRTHNDWAGHQFTVQRDVIGMTDATVNSIGVTAEGVGSRCDVWIWDDVVDEQNSATEAQRLKIKNLLLATWLSRMDVDINNPWGGVCLVVGTAWHEDDANHYLMGPKSNFVFLKMGISDDFNNIDFRIYNGDHIFGRDDVCFEGEYFRGRTEGIIDLWGNKPKEVMMDKCINDEEGVGIRVFDRAYRNRFVSSEEQIFAQILNYRDSTISVEDVINKPSCAIYMGVDLAISKRQGSAYTVMILGIMDLEDGKKYLIDVIRGKFSSPSTAALVLALGVAYNIEFGIIENNAYQEAILQWIDLFKMDLDMRYKRHWEEEERRIEEDRLEKLLDRKYEGYFSKDKDFTPKLWAWAKPYLLSKRLSSVSFRSYTSGKSLFDEKVGLPAFASEIQMGKWSIPFKNHLDNDKELYCSCDICAATKEMVSYPGGKFKDAIMAWFFLSRAMQMSKISVRNFEGKR